MANPPQGWKQGNQPNIYEANIKQINISTGLIPIVAETNKSNGSYTVYSTSGINYIGGRSPLYTVSSSGARTVQDTSTYNQLQQSGEIAKLDSSIKPKAFEINQTFGTQPEKQAVASSTLYKSLANSAQTAPAPPPIGPGGTPSAPSLPGPGQDGTGQTGELAITDPASISGVPTGSYVKYPKDMKDDQDKIKFTACEINPRTGGGGSGLQFSFGETSYTPVAGPVFLAIQSPISDQNSVDWGPDSVNAIDAAIFNASSSFMNEGEIQTKTSTFMKDLYEKTSQNQERIKKLLAGAAAGLNNVLARTDNVVLNPNLELLFQGPQLRPFSFQFKMSARGQKEANDIKKIIKYFKYHMAVRKEQGLFLRAPYVFTIQYCKGNTPGHPGLNLISPDDDKKACALTNCSVDYTPLGSYATYEDGTMAAYTLSLQFQELTPIYDTDYKDYPHEIGF
jgi:hypothetical protein